MTFRQPSALKPNDKVAIVSPSSGMPFLFPWVYEQGLEDQEPKQEKSGHDVLFLSMGSILKKPRQSIKG
jgi:hypothetical protein